MIPENEYKKFIEEMPVVCVDAIIMNSRGQYLLVKRKNEPLKNEYWVPGGRLFKNESLQSAIPRKIRQELGVECEVIMPIGVYEDFFEKNILNVKSGLHTISIVYLVFLKEGDIQLDDQSDDWGWFDELPMRLKEMTTFNTLAGLLK